jgi:hypothetical protein
MVFQFQNKRKSFAANLILDFLLLAVSFLTVYAIKRGTISIDADFQNLIPFYLVAWLIPSIFSRKFRVRENATITQKIRPFIFSAFVTIGLLSIFLSLMKWDLSRFILWGSLSIFLVLEILFLSGRTFIQSFLVNPRNAIPKPHPYCFSPLSSLPCPAFSVGCISIKKVPIFSAMNT